MIFDYLEPIRMGVPRTKEIESEGAPTQESVRTRMVVFCL